MARSILVKYIFVLMVGVLVFYVVPAFGSAYFMSFMILMLMYVTLAESWNILAGYTGYVSLGHSVFFGVGCYVFTLCIMQLKLHFILALAVSGLASAFVALIVGFILLSTRIRIGYFAIMTLGLNEIAKAIVANTEALGSSYGFTLIPIPSLLIAYYVCLALAVSSILVTIAIERSRFGLGMKSILQDEEVADSIGVNTARSKISAYVLSSIFPGILGGVIAWNWSYVDPYLAFDLAVSLNCVIMATLGGSGTIWGPVIGAIFLSVLIELLWIRIPHFHAIIFSLLVIVVVLKVPGGLTQLIGNVLQRFVGRNRAAH